MTSTTSKNNTITIKSFNNDCVICFNDLNDETEDGIINFGCKHSLCLKCFVSMVKNHYNDIKKVKCPICRKPLIEESLSEKLYKMTNEDFIIFYNGNKDNYTGDDKELLETAFINRRKRELITFRFRISRHNLNELEEILKELMECDLNNLGLWDNTENHRQEKVNIVLEYMRIKKEEENLRRRREELRNNIITEYEDKYINFYQDNRIELLESWRIRRNTYAYSLIQILLDADGNELGINEINKIIRGKRAGYSHTTIRKGLNKLIEKNYIEVANEGVYIERVRLTERYLSEC